MRTQIHTPRHTRAHALSNKMNNDRANCHCFSFAWIWRSWTFGDPYFSFQNQILFTIISTLSKTQQKINKRYIKGVPFLPKWYIKRVRGWTSGRSLPVLNVVQKYRRPSPLPPVRTTGRCLRTPWKDCSFSLNIHSKPASMPSHRN